MRPSYNTLRFDMTVARTRERIIRTGRVVESVTVVSNPAGLDAALAFYDSGDLIALNQEGLTFEEVCTDEGVYLSNPASAGMLELFVSYSALNVQGA